MSERPELERRYRRLLIWFPAEHRAVHGDEVTGVLLAAATPDRMRPGIRESLDLIRGAMLIRLRPGRALSDRDGWRDALAVFSVAAPVVLFTAVCLSYWDGLQMEWLPQRSEGILRFTVRPSWCHSCSSGSAQWRSSLPRRSCSLLS
jgi:hypothetical protein